MAAVEARASAERADAAGDRRDPRGRSGGSAPPVDDSDAFHARYAHRTARRILGVLGFVGAHTTPVRLTDVSRGTGLDTGTTHRILSTLVEAGYLHKDARTRRYSIGFEILKLGQTAPAYSLFVARSEPFLVRLAAELGATVVVASRQGPQVMLLRAIYGPPETVHPFCRALPEYVDAHATAPGKVLLAFSPREQVVSLYKVVPLRRHTARTVTNPTRLLAELETIRAQQHAVDNSGLVQGLEGISVPVFNPSGDVNYALWVQLPPEMRGTAARRHATAQATRTAREIIHYTTGRAPLAWS
ncbi:MAG: IclR family transcriptional regulator [Alphaproteobacteria bacterium]